MLADRFDRRRLMVTADIIRAVLIASIPWIHNLWALFALSAVLEILQLLWAPAKDATLPNLVERDQLMTANQLSLISSYATFPLGGVVVTMLAGIAGLLGRFDAFSILREEPITLAFFADAATFLFSALMVARFPAELMRAPRVTTQFGAKNALRDLGEGLRFIRKHPVIRSLVLGAWVAFTGGSAVISLGPIFAKKVTGGGEAAAQATWGALIIAVGVGLVGGMIAAGWIGSRFSRERIFPLGLMLSGAGVMAVATTTTAASAIALVVPTGLGAGIAWVTIFTLLQERVEDRLRGRTFATLYTGIHLSLFIGLAGWPLLAGLAGDHRARIGSTFVDLSGARLVLIGGGLFLIASGFLTGRGVRPAGRRRARMRGLRLHSKPALAGGARAGLFIAFEGVEGSGKSTQIELLASQLRAQGRDVVVTREPGGVVVAERIRQVLLDPAAAGMDAKAEAMLYAASRAQHVAEVIRPALERSAIVLCDRYIDSSLAYQGYARGLGEDDVYRLNAWATDELFPDLTVLLHVDPAVGLARVRDRNRMEDEPLEFHQAVADGYLTLARSYPSRFAVVNADGSPDVVHKQIVAVTLPFLKEGS